MLVCDGKTINLLTASALYVATDTWALVASPPAGRLNFRAVTVRSVGSVKEHLDLFDSLITKATCSVRRLAA